MRSNEDAFWVEDSLGRQVAFCYYRDPPIGTDHPARLSRRLAERTVRWFAREAARAAGDAGG